MITFINFITFLINFQLKLIYYLKLKFTILIDIMD